MIGYIATGLSYRAAISQSQVSIRLEIIAAHTDLVAIVVLLQKYLQRFGQFKAIDWWVRLDSVTDWRPGQGLEGERFFTVDWAAEHWLKKHARSWILHKRLLLHLSLMFSYCFQPCNDEAALECSLTWTLLGHGSQNWTCVPALLFGHGDYAHIFENLH